MTPTDARAALIARDALIAELRAGLRDAAGTIASDRGEDVAAEFLALAAKEA